MQVHALSILSHTKLCDQKYFYKNKFISKLQLHLDLFALKIKTTNKNVAQNLVCDNYDVVNGNYLEVIWSELERKNLREARMEI